MSRLEKRKRNNNANIQDATKQRALEKTKEISASIAEKIKVMEVFNPPKEENDPPVIDKSKALTKVFTLEDFGANEFDSASSKVSFELALKIINKKGSKTVDRLNAIKLLKGAVCPAAYKLLVHLSNDNSETVRSESIAALLEHKTSDVDFLTNLVKKNKLPSIRLSAVRRIFEVLGEKSAHTVGNALVNDQSPDVRKRAAAILGKIATSDCIEYLSKALNDKNAEVRKSTAESFGIIGLISYPLSKVRLSRLKDDDYDIVKKSADKAIRRLDELARRDKLE